MVFAEPVNRGLGSRTGAGRVSRELPTEPWPPRAPKSPFSHSREKGRFHHGLLGRHTGFGIAAVYFLRMEVVGIAGAVNTIDGNCRSRWSQKHREAFNERPRQPDRRRKAGQPGASQ